MGDITKPEYWAKFENDDWKDTVSTLLDLSGKYKNFKSIELYLPFGGIYSYVSKKIIFVNFIKIFGKDTYGLDKQKVYPVVLFYKQCKKSNKLGLSLTLEGLNIPNNNFFKPLPSYVVKTWQPSRVNIVKYLCVTEYNDIVPHIKGILLEATKIVELT